MLYTPVSPSVPEVEGVYAPGGIPLGASYFEDGASFFEDVPMVEFIIIYCIYSHSSQAELP